MKPKFSSLIAAFAPISRPSLIVVASLCAVNSANADQTWTGASGTDWNTLGNWTSAVPSVPSSSEVAIFDSTSANLATTLGVYSPVGGLRVVDPSGAVSVATTVPNSYPATSAAVAVNVDLTLDSFTYSPVTPLVAGDQVTFTATTLPGGMTAGATYFVINATATTFQISTTSGGPTAVDLTSVGSAPVVHGVISANETTNVLSFASSFHAALNNGDLVTFAAQTAPAGLVMSPQQYYVVNATPTTFQVATTRDGTPVDFTTPGLSLRATANNAARLAIAASGVDMSAATQNLTVSAPLDLTEAQTWNIATGRLFTANGDIVGAGGITKTGAGTVTLGAVNTYSGGTAIQGGKLNLAKITTSSMAKAGTGTITFSGGGTLQGNGGNNDYMSLSNNLVVADGETGNLILPPRIDLTGTLTGAADTTLNVTTNYTRDAVSGDWSGFNGQLNVGGTGQLRLGSNFGLPNAKVDIGAGATLLHSLAGNATQNLGELSGAATSILTIDAAPRAVTWSIGGLNTSSTFSGAITNGNGTSTLTKVGSGTLTLGGTSTFTGAVNLNNGTLALNSTGVITQSGSLTIQGSGSYKFYVNGGSATFTGAATLANNNGTSPFVHVNAGTFNAASFSMARTGGGLTTEPTQGFNNAGLYVEGTSDVNITGNLTINGSNSNGSARFDGGAVDVGGVVTIGLASSARWSVLDVNGATFTSTDATTGIQIGSAGEGNAIFLVRAGTATVEKITFNKPGTAVLQGVARVNGGALYIGSEGIGTTGSNTNFSTTLKLAGGVLGAKASWTSAADVNVLLSGLPTIQAADSLAAPFDITLAGAISGSAGFTKTGDGKLTLSGANTYTGTTTVSAGTLELAATTGSLKFVPTSNGVSNKITGTGTLTLKGGFNIDLTSAITTVGNTWTLVDVGSLVETFDASFSVTDFTESANVWTKADGATGNIWKFEESTGVLSYEIAPAAGGFASWIAKPEFSLAPADQGATDDPDNDGIENLLEFVLNGNPSTSDSPILPDLAVTATALEFTYQRRDDSVIETTQTFEWGTTLAAWPGSAVVPAASAVVGVATVTVSPGTPDDGVTDTVKVSILKSEAGTGGKLFGRLQVVK